MASTVWPLRFPRGKSGNAAPAGGRQGGPGPAFVNSTKPNSVGECRLLSGPLLAGRSAAPGALANWPTESSRGETRSSGNRALAHGKEPAGHPLDRSRSVGPNVEAERLDPVGEQRRLFPAEGG